MISQQAARYSRLREGEQMNCINYNPQQQNCLALDRQKECGTECPFYKSWEDQVKEEDMCEKRADMYGFNYKRLSEVRKRLWK